jgi:hypothetical protein
VKGRDSDNNQRVFLISGDQAYRYTNADYDYEPQVFVDEGYPQSIELPGDFQYGPDAAFEIGDTHICAIKDGSFLILPEGDTNNMMGPMDLNLLWDRQTNPFFDQDKNAHVDAMFIAPDGKTYIFNGEQYLRYSHFDNDYVDESYPRPIQYNWG